MFSLTTNSWQKWVTTCVLLAREAAQTCDMIGFARSNTALHSQLAEFPSPLTQVPPIFSPEAVTDDGQGVVELEFSILSNEILAMRVGVVGSPDSQCAGQEYAPEARGVWKQLMALPCLKYPASVLDPSSGVFYIQLA